MESEKYYIRNKMLTYRDLTTNTFLDISIDASSEANGKWNSLNPATICFSIYDPKVNKNISSICICMRYDNAVKLVDSVNNLFENSKSNIFSNGSVIQIPQYTLKNRKEIVFNFAMSNNGVPIIQLTVIDTTSQRGKASINLDLNAFKSIGKILKEFVDSPVSTNIGIKQLLSWDRVLENVNIIKDDICEEINNIKTIIQYSKKNNIDLNEYKDEPTEMSDIQKRFQKNFDSNNGFSNIDLGLDGIINNSSEDKNLTKTNQPFSSSCLNYDLDKLKEWATSFICTTEKSSNELFAPFDFIFNVSNISRADREQYTKNFGYYPIQYAVIYLLKKYIRESVQSGCYPTNIPALRFNTKFKRGSKEYELSKDIITIFLIYSIVVNSFKDKSEDVNRTYFTMKLLLSPFMFSIEVDDELTNELLKEYDKCEESGMFITIQDNYKSESYGGNLSISRDIFETCCGSFVKTLRDKKTGIIGSKQDTVDIFKDIEYKIPDPVRPIENCEDIKVSIFESSEKNNDKIDEEEVNKEDTKITTEPDKKLELFLDCASRVVDVELINDIKNTCGEYTELTKFFKTKDIPHELFKIKRVMDLDSSLTNKVSILKKANLLNEDEDVTETRVMQEGESVEEYNENFNIQDVLSMDGI